ncbi:MAG: pyrroline-5-carboxylate reductase [Peptococcaceae bacterium]|jgi:pyrroline-5-carboxylate reductase|nr:pyrroline-5-carboxylate reductase [Peptococcaceae bacterium]
MNKIGFIGAGNLAGSIIKGLNQSNSSYKMYLYDIQKDKADSLALKFNANSCSFREVVSNADILILAVKPQDIIQLLQNLSTISLGEKLIITVAAGISLRAYECLLPKTAIVRAMPNTSSAVLKSMTALVRGQYVTEPQMEVADKIFSCLGKVLWVKDTKMNAVTSVSGSGPAYFYLLTELMAKAGIKLGLTEDEANFLARETLIGVGTMLAEDKRTVKELREAVTSPNGTTYAAISIFREEGLENIVSKALEAAAKRALEMEGEYFGGNVKKGSN